MNKKPVDSEAESESGEETPQADPDEDLEDDESEESEELPLNLVLSESGAIIWAPDPVFSSNFDFTTWFCLYAKKRYIGSPKHDWRMTRRTSCPCESRT